MSQDAYDDIPIPSEPVLSEEETAQQLRNDFTKGYRERIAALTAQRDEMVRVLESVMAEFYERYDGAPDSGMKWMGSLMRDIDEALKKAGVV